MGGSGPVGASAGVDYEKIAESKAGQTAKIGENTVVFDQAGNATITSPRGELLRQIDAKNVMADGEIKPLFQKEIDQANAGFKQGKEAPEFASLSRQEFLKNVVDGKQDTSGTSFSADENAYMAKLRVDKEINDNLEEFNKMAKIYNRTRDFDTRNKMNQVQIDKLASMRTAIKQAEKL